MKIGRLPLYILSMMLTGCLYSTERVCQTDAEVLNTAVLASRIDERTQQPIGYFKDIEIRSLENKCENYISDRVIFSSLPFWNYKSKLEKGQRIRVLVTNRHNNLAGISRNYVYIVKVY
ncbi:hypothetical protein A4G20_00975 [Pasteurellaceae bacterium RH1A]|nr:hypothetical protein A4G20_00975 [Pasteurellaceae bacterium RH1A]